MIIITAPIRLFRSTWPKTGGRGAALLCHQSGARRSRSMIAPISTNEIYRMMGLPMDPNESDDLRRTRIATVTLDETRDLGVLQARKRRVAQRHYYQALSKARNQKSAKSGFAVDNDEFVDRNGEPGPSFRQLRLWSCKERSIAQQKSDSHKSISHVNSHSVMPEQLCHVCTHIDFARYLRPTIGKDVDNPESSPTSATTRLGKVRDIVQRHNCSFCRLVAAVIQLNILDFNVPSLEDMNVVLCTRYVSFLHDTKDHQKEISQIRLEFLHPIKGWPMELPLHHNLQLAYSTRPEKTSFDSGRCLQGRFVNSTEIEIGLLQQWLGVCEHNHGPTCNDASWLPSTRQPAILRVLDVRTLCVIDAPPHCRFAALSYVWGSSSMPKPKKLHGETSKWDYSDLYEALPRTIRDAIFLMGKLGESYLWVDSMCIDQEDEKDKLNQIGQMDNIYGLAFFTIVAAAGSNADAGLPGLHPGDRFARQRSGVVQNMKLTTTLPAEVPVDWSIWNQRGWTFQERLLSKRCVIFTDHQVYFQCKRRNWSEDTHIDDDPDVRMNVLQTYRRFESLQSPAAPSFFQTLTSDLSIPTAKNLAATGYESLVEAYTRREFTKSSDALHAFRGIEKILSRRIPGQFHYGLPDILLDEALLWQPVLTASPNFELRPFPSYSWASWDGPVHYNHQPGIRSVIQWLHEMPDGSLGTMDSPWLKRGGHAGWGDDERHLRAATKSIIDAFNQKFPAGRLKSLPPPSGTSENQAEKEQANIHSFYTKFAQLRIEPFRPQPANPSEWCICKVFHGEKEMTTTPGRHLIETTVPVTIALPGSWVRDHSHQPCEFILIALECRSFTQHAHVMLVEPLGNNYRRVGLTKIEWAQWDQAVEPEIKLIGLL